MLQDLAFKAMDKGLRALGMPSPAIDLRLFEIDPAERERLSAETTSELGKVFFAHNGRIVNKWIRYLDVYDRYFAPYRNSPVKMLEIGVYKGGSLELWREYFGAKATIFGIDIDPECANCVTPPTRVRIGSQGDPAFLRSVVDELGQPNIVVDDGSHIGRLQQASFNALFPLLQDGGLYIIEDLHTSYLRGTSEGGYRRRGTCIEFVKDMIDDMHAWYHHRQTATPAKEHIRAIHIYDSMVVIEKQRIGPPAYIKISKCGGALD